MAALTAASMLLGGTAAGVLGQNVAAGATEAENETLNNRVLHPQEQQLAQQLATQANAQGITNPDGSPVTTTNVSNQLAQMGYSQNGVTETGAPATIFGVSPPSDGTTWFTDGVTGDSTQALGSPNPALPTFILQNTNSSDVPLAQQYTASPGVATATSSGTAFNFTIPTTQQQLADDVGNLSSQLSIVSATSGAVASANGGDLLVAEPAAAFSLTTGVSSYVLGGVQQLLSPNVGQYATESGLIGLATYVAGDEYPLLGPVITQAGNMLPNTPWVASFEKKISSIFTTPGAQK